MREVNKYKAEVIIAGGKKEYYFGPTLEITCEICERVQDMQTYKVIHRETGMVAARYIGSGTAYKGPADSLKSLYAKDIAAEQKDNEEIQNALKEVAVASC